MLLRKILLITILYAFDTNAAQLLHQGTLSCLTKNHDTVSAPASCELSAANVIMATDLKTKFLLSWNDKDHKLYIFNLQDIVVKKEEFSRNIAPIYAQDMAIKKVESITSYQDTGFVVGSYIREDDPEYSKILSFNITPEGLTTNIQEVAGLELKNKIRNAYQDAGISPPGYIKIEATVIIPSDSGKMEMILGVREYGLKDYKDFKYSVTIFGVTLNKSDTGFKLSNDMHLIRDDSIEMVGQGVSDLSLNNQSSALLMSTSIEENDILGGDLWLIDSKNLSNGKFQWVDTNNVFKGHKPEGVAWITQNENQNENTVLIIADDDRVNTDLAGEGQRSLLESPFWYLKL